MTIRIPEAQKHTNPDAEHCIKLCWVRPVSPALGMDIVTSSQTLREKDIQPSKLNFGFIGLG
jgi:hypothetical protein